MSFEKFRRLRKPLESLFGKSTEDPVRRPPTVPIPTEVKLAKMAEESNNDKPLEYPKMVPTIYSYYADFQNNKYYEEFAKKLISRCQEFGVPYNISERESRGNYGANCLMKPEFILEKLKEERSPIIWMDCDTDFKFPFTEFNYVKEDIGMATHSGDLSGIKASPLYFNYTPGAFKIIREWVVHSRAAYVRNIPELDHDALKHYVLPYLKNSYSIFLLSQNWNDFVHGKYIFNGNSKVEGKMEIHRKVSVDDNIRATYSENVKTMYVYFNGVDKSVFKSAYNFLNKFSNYSRVFFHFDKELEEYKNCEEFNLVNIESGANLLFSNNNFDTHKYSKNEIVFDVLNIEDIQEKWDTKTIDEILMNRNPLYSLNFKDNGLGYMRIKNHAKVWD